MDPAATRCAVHPARPAVDACPVCARGRCGPDADATRDGGCAVCRGGTPDAGRVPAGGLELLVRAALAAYAVALVMGLVVSEYVGAGLFAYVTPLLLGVLCGEAAQRAAGTTRPGAPVRAAAAVLAPCGVGVGLLLEGSVGLLSGPGAAALGCAVAGAVLWTVPPRPSSRTTPESG